MKINRDQIVADARSLPDLIAKAQVSDPDLAKQLTGKALWTSKSPPAILLAAAIAWVSTHYGLGWDSDTVALVTAAVGVIVAYAMRYITVGPITGVIKAPVIPPAPASVPSTPPAPAVSPATTSPLTPSLTGSVFASGSASAVPVIPLPPRKEGV